MAASSTFFSKLKKVLTEVETDVKEVEEKIYAPRTDLSAHAAREASRKLKENYVNLIDELTKTYSSLTADFEANTLFISHVNALTAELDKSLDEIAENQSIKLPDHEIRETSKITSSINCELLNTEDQNYTDQSKVQPKQKITSISTPNVEDFLQKPKFQSTEAAKQVFKKPSNILSIPEHFTKQPTASFNSTPLSYRNVVDITPDFFRPSKEELDVHIKQKLDFDLSQLTVKKVVSDATPEEPITLSAVKNDQKTVTNDTPEEPVMSSIKFTQKPLKVFNRTPSPPKMISDFGRSLQLNKKI